MSKILTLKLDVTKFDKSAFFKGAKGTYADVTVFLNDEADDRGQFGMVTQDLGKERRDAGEKGPILGNVTRVHETKPRQPAAPAMNRQANQAQERFTPQDEPDIPF